MVCNSLNKGLETISWDPAISEYVVGTTLLIGPGAKKKCGWGLEKKTYFQSKPINLENRLLLVSINLKPLKSACPLPRKMVLSYVLQERGIWGSIAETFWEIPACSAEINCINPYEAVERIDKNRVRNPYVDLFNILR